jgi:hypothetical protein
MKLKQSMFSSDCVKLSFVDVFKLLLGFEIQQGALIVGLWRMPKNYLETTRGIK